MIEGWLLYNREDYEKNRFFADRLVTESIRQGLVLKIRFAEEIRAGIRDCRTALFTGNDEGRLPIPSFAVNRTRNWLLAECLERADCRVFNSASASRVCNDKIESHLLAARLGLPQVDMVFCRNTPAGVARHGLDYPVVLKSPYGHGGGEVFLADDVGELMTAAALLKCGWVIVQRLCGRPGVDVRVYVLGGSILTAVKRHSASGFRANLSLGGDVEPYELSIEGRQMAERILRALWLDYAGIDFLLDETGNLLFNELEDAVGSRSLYRLGSHDAAALYMDYIAKTVGSIKT